MKKISALLFLLILFKILHAQQNTFQKSFSIDSSQDYDYKIKILPGDRTVLIGRLNCNNIDCAKSVSLIVLNKDGSKFLSKLFINKFYSVYISDVIITKDSGFLMVGGYGNKTGEEDYNLIVIKANKKGKQQWAKAYKSKQKIQILHSTVIEDKNGNFIIASNAAYSKTSAQITKLDLHGNVIWTNAILFQLIALYDKMENRSLVQTDDGFYFAGSFFDEFYGINKNWGCIIKFSQEGKVSNVKALDIPINQLYKSITINNVVKRNNDIYFLGSFVSTNKFNDVDTVAYSIIKYDPSARIQRGTIVLGKKQKIVSLSFDEQLLKLQAWSRNNKYLLPFEYDSRAAFYADGALANIWRVKNNILVTDFYIKKFDSLGRICPTYSLTKIDTVSLKKQYVLSNVKYSVLKDSFAVTNILFTDSSIAEQHTICSGFVQPVQNLSQQNVILKNNKQASITPNPVKNNFVLTYYAAQPGKAFINIYSSQGKTVLSEKVIFTKGLNTQIINTQTLPGGIYVLNIQNGINNSMLKFLKD